MLPPLPLSPSSLRSLFPTHFERGDISLQQILQGEALFCHTYIKEKVTAPPTKEQARLFDKTKVKAYKSVEPKTMIRIGDAHSEMSSECKLFTNVWRNR